MQRLEALVCGMDSGRFLRRTWAKTHVRKMGSQMSLGLPVQPGPYLREGAVRLELLGGGGTLSEGV